MFDKAPLLDLVRNFIVFEDDGEKVIKKLAGYHQFHAVNKAVETTLRAAGVQQCSAAVPAAGSGGVLRRAKGTPGGTPGEPAGGDDKVWLIDFANPEANEFLAVNQFTVEEGHFNRRADVVVFINGIPLAVLELKNIADEQATIRKAFDQFQTYKAQIPSLFHSNALLVISDGHEAKLGTITSDWERFMTWRTITGKELVPPGSLQLETLLKGVFDKHRLLDLIRNFIVFEDDGEKVMKKLAGYHQFHAVNKAVEHLQAAGFTVVAAT